jgi:hypothetical protein
MRSIVLALAAVAAVSTFQAKPAAAQSSASYPWCSHNPSIDVTSCGFNTFAQCQASVSGVGGYCIRNPQAAYGYEPQRSRRDRSRYYDYED